MKINKFPKGIKKLNFGKSKVLLHFDKNGGLCEMTPRIGEILTHYRGRTRLCVKEIINIIHTKYENELL